MGKLTEKPCPGGCGDKRPRRVSELCFSCGEAIRRWRKHEARLKREADSVFEIEGERVYPIWETQARWLQDKQEKDDQEADAPEGQMWNSTSWFEMFKDEQTPRQMMAKALDRTHKMLSAEKYAKVNASGAVTCVRFVRREVWCLTWFSHYTFDTGQTDKAALDSFARYVSRTQDVNLREGKTVNGSWQEPYCLMGAEDRFRWTGSGDSGSPGWRTDPPCRCKHCKEQGLIRIGH